ncbi:MAG: UDP-glucose 4-epimerase, partial [bacterium]
MTHSLRGARVLITGGAGAVGSNLADQLVGAGASEIVVLDNLVRGRRANLDWAIEHGNVDLVEGDIRDRALV